MLKKILAVVLPVAITIVFALADFTLPLRQVPGLSLAIFVGAFFGYLWVRKRYNLTFGRLTLMALVVAAVSAAVLVTSNLLASYVF